jgi:hypothetical protein
VTRARPPNPSTTTMTPSGTLLAFDRFLESLEESISLLSTINFSHELASSYTPCSLLIFKPSEKGIISLFDLYYTPEIIDLIVKKTNEHMRELNDNSRPYARANNWYLTCVKEIYLYFAIRIYMTLHIETRYPSIGKPQKMAQFILCQSIWAGLALGLRFSRGPP